MNAHWKDAFEVGVWSPARPARMLQTPLRADLARALLEALYLQGEELRRGPELALYVRDDGLGNALLIPEPAPEGFVAALAAALPEVTQLPVDLAEVSARLVMRVGAAGVRLGSDDPPAQPQVDPIAAH